MDVTSLSTYGYVLVQYPPPLRAAVVESMDAWREFCALPLETKSIFSHDDRVVDFGYMRRKDVGPNADDKELFHVKCTNLERLQACAAHAPEGALFLDAAHRLIDATMPVVCAFAEGVERAYKVPHLARDVRSSSTNWTFRYLHYMGGDVLAHPHVDRDGFTLHLFESAPGGEYLGHEMPPYGAAYSYPHPRPDAEQVKAHQRRHVAPCYYWSFSNAS